MIRKLYSRQFWRGPLRGCVVGVLTNPHALWVGLHYSRWNRRFCLNIVPCITLWITLEGGDTP